MAVCHITPIAKVSELGSPDILPFSGPNAELSWATEGTVKFFYDSLVWLGRQMNLRKAIAWSAQYVELFSALGYLIISALIILHSELPGVEM